jgi:ATPase family associated with various cellular activities (AAA)
MTLADSLREYIEACFSGIWVESCEHPDAVAEIAGLCQRQDPPWSWATWDIEAGLQIPGRQPAGKENNSGQDPLAAIRSIPALATANGTAILVLHNFHRFLQSAEIVQALARQILAGKQNRTIVIVLSPVVQIPVELEKLFVVVEHPLPAREQLLEIAGGVATEKGDLPEGIELQRLLDAAAGLTRYEPENALSLSLIRHGNLQVETLWELKSQTLRKSDLLTLHRGGERFDDLGGLEALKAFCKRALRSCSSPDSRVRPRGVLLLSPPGCGKSQFCKALGNETGRPTLVLDVGSLLGSLVGQSEANIRQALRIIDAMAPAVCFLDEVEKAFSGVASSGQTDSGVSARLFGTFLSWLNDHETDVFVVATANDITKLPPEFSRAERFDGVFFLDLPDSQQRQAIWNIYRQHYGLDSSQKLPADDLWTGAEIKSCCRLAALLDLPLAAAAQNIVPVAQTSAESVEKLRQWAAGRCLSADQVGIYQPGGGGSNTRRRINRSSSGPSLN